MSDPSTTTTTVHLKATYTFPDEPNPITLSAIPLSLPLSLSQSQEPAQEQSTKDKKSIVEDKTTYLRALRTATTTLQDAINADLTSRMERDVANAASNSGSDSGSGSGSAKTAKAGKGGAVDEAAEEENYGEEVVEDDEV
ncbi:hypothetical protein F5Y03DRAFT_243753 [Xylaria venustula]|nr:hypothetical protein F5Y03DRAFT_243753 [Xylaria venustula]